MNRDGVDGRLMPQDLIPLADDGGEYEVLVRMGESGEARGAPAGVTLADGAGEE